MKLKTQLVNYGLLTLLVFLMQPSFAQMKIKIQNIKKAEGSLRVGLYETASAYDGEEEVAFGKIVAVDKKGELSFEMNEIPFGKYSIAVFHDYNSNDKLDTNFLGIPKEAYGFSNNPRAKFRKPKFEESLINYTQENQQFEINLISW